MMQILLVPPSAFLIYLLLITLLSFFGRSLAGRSMKPSSLKSSTYSSGEAPPTRLAAPGYRPFFVVALFFAVLHLGILVLSTGSLTPVIVIYLVGLLLAILPLILGYLVPCSYFKPILISSALLFSIHPNLFTILFFSL